MVTKAAKDRFFSSPLVVRCGRDGSENLKLIVTNKPSGTELERGRSTRTNCQLGRVFSFIPAKNR